MNTQLHVLSFITVSPIYLYDYLKWCLLFCGILVFVVVPACIYYLKRKILDTPSHIRKANTATPSTPLLIPSPSIRTKANEATDIHKAPDFSKQCICLLGDFRVIDKNGDDITQEFTPTMKSLLILLLLFSEGNGKEIPNSKIHELLWSAKRKPHANNNRKVYLSKLRGIFEKVGNIEIINQNEMTKITIGEDVCCDYKEAMRHFASLSTGRPYTEQEYDQLLNVLRRGSLLPYTRIPWVNEFQEQFLNKTRTTLLAILKDPNISDPLKSKAADVLLLHDYINEDALFTKCRILSEAGKAAVANTVYDIFCRDHLDVRGIEYRRSFIEVLKRSQSTTG